MNPLFRILLRAKAWQLFTLTFALPLIFGAVYFGSILGRMFMLEANGLSAEALETASVWGIVFTVVALIADITLYLWSLAAGIECNKLTPKEARRKTGLFVFAIVFTLLMLLSLFVAKEANFFGTLAGGTDAFELDNAYIEAQTHKAITMIIVLIPAALVNIACAFYAIYFTAKSIKSAELQREARFEDYAAEFFLILFYFIGLWIVQPKLNKMTEKAEQGKNEPATAINS